MVDKDLFEALKFYDESGIDCTLKEEECSLAKEKAVDQKYTTDHIQKSSLTIHDYIIQAKKLANQCCDIPSLKKAVESFEGCEIKKLSTNTVFSDGNPKAKVMLIGEAPGANEDLQGIPFCGASGMLLDKMLKAIGLDRNTVYISNTVFWRPPGNRKPTDFELEACRPFVEKHIALVNPKILILVGGTACTLLETKDSISKLRGKFYNYTNQFLNDNITTTVLFHPAYLLRQPMQKRLAWEDLQQIKSYIDSLSIDTEL